MCGEPAVLPRYRGFASYIWPLAICAAMTLTAANAAFAQGLGGTVRLVGASTESQADDTQSLNQEYNLYWDHRLVPGLQGRAAFRYSKFGTDLGNGAETWREELQPGGLLTWKHSWWSVIGDYRYRRSNSNDRTTDLIRNNLGATFRAHAAGYPTTNAGLEYEGSYNQLNRAIHDTRRTRIFGNTSYSIRRAQLYYGATLLYGRNRSAHLETAEARHLFRWNQSAEMFDNRMRLGTSYNFSRRSETTTLLGSDTALRLLEPIEALYAQDATPDLGELDTLAALIDGNYDTPTAPPIDIGEGKLDHNLGLDLGYPREVAALYIYTDRPSGTALSWAFYTSDDNLTWNRYDTNLRSLYNASAERYELTFSEVAARYIKAVSTGTNEVRTVLVTEVEALEPTTIDDKRSRGQTSHQANMSSTYSFSKSWQAAMDLDLRYEPNGDFAAGSNRAGVGIGATHSPSVLLRQSIRIQASQDSYQITDATERDRSLSYTLILTPLPTARMTLAAQTRASSHNGMAMQETHGLSLRGLARLLPGLEFTSETGVTRHNILVSGREFNTWTARLNTDAQVTRSLAVTALALYQTTSELDASDRRIRKRYGADATWQVTAAVSLRAALTVSFDDSRRYLEQDYRISWALSRKLSISALSQTSAEDSIVRSKRRVANINLAATQRTTLFASYLYSGADEDNLPEIHSMQFGLISGF